MTTIKSRKEYDFDGRKVFVERYQDKDMAIPLWRYGELYDNGLGLVLQDRLRSRPNMKRLFRAR